MRTLNAGIDVGSTTVKLVLIDENGERIYGEYRRHCANIRETLSDLLGEAQKCVGEVSLRTKITGSGSINLSKSLGVGFIQEVAAEASALKNYAPHTDVAIELGGEDAKIIYFTGGLEERMNGVCAGGTGSFIDQMAALLQTDASGLNEYAKSYHQLYPIAARCGVFAKSDIQPLINEGATREDLSASIFQAVVNQTISGLACGKPIKGNVAFLGGPLHFLTELKAAFIRTLKLTPEHIIDPEDSHLFPAMGAAQNADEEEIIELSVLIDRWKNAGDFKFELKRLDPLFVNRSEFESFTARHNEHKIKRENIENYHGNCFLGIDAGSTTTKLALVGDSGQLLWSFYSNNEGSPIKTTQRALADLSNQLPKGAVIARSCSTGYGETLLKSALVLDDGEVETIAHYTAAAFFDPQVECVLDIGGQDMKCIKIKNGTVDTVLLNEACSSGCGSFLENFAVSLGYTVEDFAKAALFAEHPLDLGTRCTVFMNSNVKQAQKEGASVEDISAGLAYSVIRNALFKVIKLTDTKTLGSRVLVQGGTFNNNSVLRAFENLTGIYAIRPDIAGLMGAFGAALIAKDRFDGNVSSMLSFEDIAGLKYETSTVRCGGCTNNCLLTVNKFEGGRKHISGNRCEKKFGGEGRSHGVPNLVAYKLNRMFDYPTLSPKNAPRGVIAIPRVLNMYENFPFWATFFYKLGFSVALSPLSSRKIYERGMESIPSESLCYPAKMSHGHIQWLIDHGYTRIFYPSVYYERQEPGTQNKYNCPIVIGCPENINNNVEAITDGSVEFLHPFVAFTSEKVITDRLIGYMKETFGIADKETLEAVGAAWNELISAKNDVRAEGQRALDWIENNSSRGIVLAGRPYHCDPEINHGIPELITSYGLAVLTEDSLPFNPEPERPLRVNDQWSYHSRLYSAAAYVRTRDDIELIQLNSFGCGLDAVTADQVCEILEGSGKLFTLLKIDEINNLGAARIRVRSLIAAMNIRSANGIKPSVKPYSYNRTVYTEKMQDEKYTIIAPQLSPIHFSLVQAAFNRYGYNFVILDNDTRNAVNMGQQYVNNDACYPSLIITGQIMDAVLSGKYNTNKLAILMSQTGGCCRATNYLAFIRRALDSAGYGHIPVVSLNLGKIETNPGFKLTPQMMYAAVSVITLGDLMMKCLYRTRPYESIPGSANALHRKWEQHCIDKILSRKFNRAEFKRICRGIVKDFDELPLDETLKKPRVGIVGEILVKYMPLANNHLVDLLEKEGAEVVVPDFLDFFEFSAYGRDFRHKYLGGSRKSEFLSKVLIQFFESYRKPAEKALAESKRFSPHTKIEELAEIAKPYLSIGNQYGEGWFLTAEMVHLIESGTPNIVCIQPFGCLPNHIVGKGVIKAVKKTHPESNVVAVDYDPGASEVNQLNRIKLMLSSAVTELKKEVKNSPVEEKEHANK